MTKLLLVKGVQVNVRNKKDIVALLIAKDAQVNVRDEEYGIPPLHWAVQRAHEDVVKLPIANGAEINAKSKNPPLLGDYRNHIYAETPLHLVWDRDIAALLIANGADVNAKDEEFDQTPLHALMGKGFERIEDIAEFLLVKGADVNAKDKYYKTPLHWVAKYGYLDVVELLIISDADVNAKSREGATPLDEGLENRLMEIAEILIDNGAQVNSKNAKNILAQIPLYAAMAKGYNNMVELLKSYGAIAPNGVMRQPEDDNRDLDFDAALGFHENPPDNSRSPVLQGQRGRERIVDVHKELESFLGPFRN